MLVQSLLVALIVAACAVYVAWTLMPAPWRRGLALASLKLPLPAGVATFMRRHSVAASGCACDGCDKSAAPAASPKVQTIVLHPRMRK